MIEEHNREAYHNFCGPEVQGMPERIEQAIRAEGDTRRAYCQFREPLKNFVDYAPYATRETLVRILDRLTVGIATVRLPPTRDFFDFGTQLQNLRDNCAMIEADPRAKPRKPQQRLGCALPTARLRVRPPR
jgi:hypothetical protein